MDRIVLPKKFQYLCDEIQHRIVSRFLLTLDQKKIADAAAKGYTHLSINILTSELSLREDRIWVIATKPESKSKTDFVKIKEIPGGVYHDVPIAMSINEACDVYGDILYKVERGLFYPKRTISKAKKVKSGYLKGLSRNPESVMSCPTSWLPYTLLIRKACLRKVQDYDWEGLQMEGVERHKISQEDYDEAPSYWKKHADANGVYYSISWGSKNDERHYAIDKDTLYRRFIRDVYGRKVWDNNETVVELTVYPGLNDNFYYNKDIFLKFCEALLEEDDVEKYRKMFNKKEE